MQGGLQHPVTAIGSTQQLVKEWDESDPNLPVQVNLRCLDQLTTAKKSVL
jgi:hypothetical protein